MHLFVYVFWLVGLSVGWLLDWLVGCLVGLRCFYKDRIAVLIDCVVVGIMVLGDCLMVLVNGSEHLVIIFWSQ